jgi:hypothetical protein
MTTALLAGSFHAVGMAIQGKIQIDLFFSGQS